MWTTWGLLKKKFPIENLRDKHLWRWHWVCYVLAIYGWAQGLSLRVVRIPSETPLETADFSSVRDYQPDISFKVRDRTYDHSSQWQNPIRHRSKWTLCMFPHSEWVHVCVGSAAFTSLASLVSSIPFGSYNVSSSTRFSESRSVGFDGGNPWVDWKFHSISLSSYGSFVWVSAFVLFCFRRKMF